MDAARPYPVMLAVAGRLAVVVGGDAGAMRSVKSLVAHGADVVVIAPAISSELMAMEAEGRLTTEPRAFTPGDLDGALIVIAASGSPKIDALVAESARERGVLVNIAADAAASDFIVPSVVRRGDLQIAVTTGGGAPSVAREVRRGIAAAYGPEWEAYTSIVAQLRVLAVERTGLSDAQLAPLFAEVADSDLRVRLAAGEVVTAQQVYDQHGLSLATSEGGVADSS